MAGDFCCKEIYLQGWLLQAGGGYHINPWCDLWIPSLEGFIPKAKVEIDTSSWRRVADFKMLGSNNWNFELIMEVFKAQSAQAIFALKWPPLDCQDKLLWLDGPQGIFSVRSYLLNNPPREEVLPMWKMDIHERLKVFYAGWQRKHSQVRIK